MAGSSLTAQQQRFVNGYIGGKSAAEAARLAGYGPAYSKKAATNLLKQPAIKAAVEAEQEKARKTSEYDLAAAVREADSLIAFARANKNPMAAVKAWEIKSKLFGLLVDRLKVEEHVDVGGALLEARRRSSLDVQDVAYTLVDASFVDPFS